MCAWSSWQPVCRLWNDDFFSHQCLCLHPLLPLQWYRKEPEVLLCQGWYSLLLLPARRLRELPQLPPSGSFTRCSCVACFLPVKSFDACFLTLCCFQHGHPSVISPLFDSSLQVHFPSSPLCRLSPHIPTLQHVPKGARDHWAHILSVCLSSVVKSPADLSQWTRLFMLPKFGPSAMPSPTVLAPPIQPSLQDIYLAGLLLPCDVAMPACGCTAIQLSPPLSGRGSLAVFLIPCTVPILYNCILLIIQK